MPNGSLYDDYKLSNSTAIPHYEGSTADAALQVGQYEQGLYDTARTMGDNIQGNLDSIKSLPGDQPTADKLRDDTTNTLAGYAKAGNWEDNVEPVRQLGTNFANRAAELAAPLAAYQEWNKTVVENKDNKLTPYQKQGLTGLALENYTPLTKTGTGRLVGEFNAPDIAPNMDENEFADKAMKDAVAHKWGSDVTIDNGVVKNSNGQTLETMTPQRIRDIVSDAQRNSTDFQAYRKQEGAIAGFHGKQNAGIMQVDPSVQPLVDAYTKNGIPYKEAVGNVMSDLRTGSTSEGMIKYAIDKYKRDDSTTKSDHTETKDPLLPAMGGTQIVQDTLDNLTNKYPNLDAMNKARNDASTTKTSAATLIDAAKQTTRRWYDTQNGTGAYDKLGPEAAEGALKNYYNTLPSGGAQYSNLQATRKSYQDASTTMDNIDQAHDYVKNYTYGQMGTSTQEQQQNAKSDIINGLQSVVDNKSKDVNGNNMYVNLDGKQQKMTKQQVLDMVKGSIFVKADNNSGNDQVLFKTADGKTLDLASSADAHSPLYPALQNYINKGNMVNKNMAKYQNDAMKNYSQASPIVTSGSEAFNTTAKKALMGADKTIYDAAGHLLPDTDDLATIKNRIDHGEFEYIGTYSGSKDGQNTMVKISVNPDKAADKNQKPITLRIGLKGSLGQSQSDVLMKEATDQSTGKITDRGKYETAMAMRPGSSYTALSQSTNLGNVVNVYQKNADGSNGPLILSGEKTTENGQPKLVVKDPSGTLYDGTNGKEDYSDQVHFGATLDQLKNNPKVNVVYK